MMNLYFKSMVSETSSKGIHPRPEEVVPLDHRVQRETALRKSICVFNGIIVVGNRGIRIVKGLLDPFTTGWLD